jgi:hypothetical protein
LPTHTRVPAGSACVSGVSPMVARNPLSAKGCTFAATPKVFSMKVAAMGSPRVSSVAGIHVARRLAPPAMRSAMRRCSASVITTAEGRMIGLEAGMRSRSEGCVTIL